MLESGHALLCHLLHDLWFHVGQGWQLGFTHVVQTDDVETKDQAEAILASLKKGGKFEDIAKKQSKDPGSGANGGDLDWAAPGNYVKEFSDAMVALNKGQVSAPVQSQFGFHIIRLDDVREAQLPALADVKPQIVQQMTQQRMATFQQELRAKAKVE